MRTQTQPQTYTVYYICVCEYKRETEEEEEREYRTNCADDTIRGNSMIYCRECYNSASSTSTTRHETRHDDKHRTEIESSQVEHKSKTKTMNKDKET